MNNAKVKLKKSITAFLAMIMLIGVFNVKTINTQAYPNNGTSLQRGGGWIEGTPITIVGIDYYFNLNYIIQDGDKIQDTSVENLHIGHVDDLGSIYEITDYQIEGYTYLGYYYTSETGDYNGGSIDSLLTDDIPAITTQVGKEDGLITGVGKNDVTYIEDYKEVYGNKTPYIGVYNVYLVYEKNQDETIIEYTITYEGVDDTTGYKTTYTTEDTTYTLPTPTKEGYTFVHWLDDNGNTATELPTGSTGNKVFTAVWSATEYTITYEGVDDTTGYKTTYTTEDTTYTLPTPTKEGYIFVHWLDDNGNIATEHPTGSTGNKVFTAVWSATEYTITYEGVDDTTGYKTTYTTEDTTYTLPTPTKEGYTFVHWLDDNGNTATELPTGSTGNKVFTAVWAATEYTITYEGVDDTTGYKTTYTTEDTTYTLPTPTEEGYTFVHWLDDNGNTATELPTGSTGNKVFTAVWEEIIINNDDSLDNDNGSSTIDNTTNNIVKTSDVNKPNTFGLLAILTLSIIIIILHKKKYLYKNM